MTLRRVLTLLALVGTATVLQAQQPGSAPAQSAQPTFKEHKLGESAQEFFAVAKMGDKNGMLSSDYCRAFLDQPKVKKALEKADRKGWDDSASPMAIKIDVEGCDTIAAAIAGKDVVIPSRFASELGEGSARFVAGHLASVRFVVKAPFNDVVEDMTAKLNAKPQLEVATLQNAVAGIQKQRRAIWTLANVRARIAELESLEGVYIGTEVSVSSPEVSEHRTNSLN
jgi:hypothetical protein